MSVTPRPWRDAETMGAIVSDDPDAIAARGPDNLRGYGGAIVCESAEKPDRDFIIRAANEYHALIAIEEVLKLARPMLGMSVSNSLGAQADRALAQLDAVRSTT